MSGCSTGRAACRCTCSSISTANPATAARRWSTWRRITRRNGYSIDANELPDYLPLFLEFLSLVEPGEAAELLSDVAHILAAIRVRLERRGSDYAGVFRALEELAARKPDRATVESLLQHDKSREEEAAELDREWEEAPAFGGAPDGGCVAARDVLNRMAELAAAPRGRPDRTEHDHG